MLSQSPQHPGRVAKLLALACAACLVNGCAWIIGIEDLPPPECETNANCEEKRGPAWTCDTENYRCVPPSAVECGNSDQCTRADEPICDTTVGACKPCHEAGGDIACGLRDSAKAPFCVRDGASAGACAACLHAGHCTAEAPTCDPDAKSCGACEAHRHCKQHSGVCGDDGMCVPEDNVIYVVKTGTDVDTCSRAMPCGTVGSALALVTDTRRYILLDDMPYAEHLDLENVDVTIIGSGASIIGIEDKPIIHIADDVALELEGLILRSLVTDSTAAGVRCASGSKSSTIRLSKIVVRDNGGVGVDVTQCTLDVARSMLTNNAGGGIDVSNAAFSIVNSFIVGNGRDAGSPVSNFGGVRLVNGDPYEPQFFAFNTIAENRAGSTAYASGAWCSVNASSTVVATSSIIRKGYGGKPTLAGDCEWSNSNVEEGAALSALAPTENGNNYDDCSLTDDGTGIYRFTQGSPCDNSGQVDTGIDVDYEGQARPAIPGMPPDMGADELHAASSR